MKITDESFECAGVTVTYDQKPNELKFELDDDFEGRLDFHEVIEFQIWLEKIYRTMEEVAAVRHMNWQANQNAPRLGVSKITINDRRKD